MRHALGPSTHTLELDQVAELNAQLAAGRGLAPAALDLPATGALRQVIAEGPPNFPYLYGRFDDPAGGRMPLHTEHLRALSRQLHLNHHWGV